MRRCASATVATVSTVQAGSAAVSSSAISTTCDELSSTSSADRVIESCPSRLAPSSANRIATSDSRSRAASSNRGARLLREVRRTTRDLETHLERRARIMGLIQERKVNVLEIGDPRGDEQTHAEPVD